MDPYGKEDFIRVDVADARDAGLIQQTGLDGPPAPAEGPQKVGGIHVRVKGLRPQAADPGKGVRLPGAFQPQTAKAAHVAEAQLAPVIQIKDGVRVLFRGNIGRRQQQLSGHAQVDHNISAVFQVKQQKFSAPVHGTECLSAGGAAEILRGRVCRHPRCEQLRAQDPAAAQLRFQHTADGFDLG